jgi:hypothetical protein
MDLPSKTIVDVLTYLLPGFITAELLHALTPAPRPVPFERTIQALIFTIIIQVELSVTKYGLIAAGKQNASWGPWSDARALGWSVGLAFAFGLFLVWAANSDRIHRVLRWCRITHQTSYSSEWYGAFCRHKGYVVLHLKGERKLLGWPEEWPNTPDNGHFVVASAQWLEEEDGAYKVLDLAGVRRVLVKAQDVEMVELMEPVTEEKTHGRSESTNASATAAQSNEQRRDIGTTATIPAESAATATTKEIGEDDANGRQQGADSACATTAPSNGCRAEPRAAAGTSTGSAAATAGKEVISQE